jgi:hypothetical protein
MASLHWAAFVCLQVLVGLLDLSPSPLLTCRVPLVLPFPTPLPATCLQLRLRRGGEEPAAGPGPAPSSLPGLPSCPADAGRPLATLTLVLHRVDLDEQPPGGFWVLLKCGPHWARTRVR